MSYVTQWDGVGFVPIGRYRRQCDAEMVIGQVYTLDVILGRSDSSHRHYFAAVHASWENLPEEMADRFPTDEHLRKWALIKAGYADERSIVCASEAEATRVAAFVQPMDSFAVVVVLGQLVRVYTAKSQSYKTMDKDTFQASKTAVLEIISDLVGVTRQQLEKASA